MAFRNRETDNRVRHTLAEYVKAGERYDPPHVMSTANYKLIISDLLVDCRLHGIAARAPSSVELNTADSICDAAYRRAARRRESGSIYSRGASISRPHPMPLGRRNSVDKKCFAL
jgi:hypothetical protein